MTMAKEYIPREDVINDIGELFTICRETLPNECGHHFIVENELQSHLDFVRNLPAADVVERPRWISVTEQLPDAYEDVLLLFPHNQAAGFCDRDGCWGVYSGDGFYTEVADNEPKPTHWARKLPEPQKEEEANV